MDVRLVVVAPTPSRKAYKVRLPVVVGRGDEAKVRLAHDSVSRRHCEFTADGGVVYVTDLGSTNGTVVDAAKVEPHAATAVSNGAQVRIGGVVVRLEYAATAGVPAPVSSMDDTVPLPDPAAPDDMPNGGENSTATEFPGGEAAAPGADFATLAGGEPTPAAADGSFEFLGGEPEAAPAADDKLDDFFKSLP
jgi:pSer/pThr/pTyr-binding forkhead associated (FHA) protein